MGNRCFAAARLVGQRRSKLWQCASHAGCVHQLCLALSDSWAPAALLVGVCGFHRPDICSWPFLSPLACSGLRFVVVCGLHNVSWLWAPTKCLRYRYRCILAHCGGFEDIRLQRKPTVIGGLRLVVQRLWFRSVVFQAGAHGLRATRCTSPLGHGGPMIGAQCLVCDTIAFAALACPMLPMSGLPASYRSQTHFDSV